MRKYHSDQSGSTPQTVPIMYEARPEDRAFLVLSEQLLLEQGRSVAAPFPVRYLGESACWGYRAERGAWSFQMLNIEPATKYTTAGSTVFSLFWEGVRTARGSHFIMDGVTTNHAERAITYTPERPLRRPSQLAVQQYFNQFRHDAERLIAGRRPHDLMHRAYSAVQYLQLPE